MFIRKADESVRKTSTNHFHTGERTTSNYTWRCATPTYFDQEMVNFSSL
jgi:hypothetical protein